MKKPLVFIGLLFAIMYVSGCASIIRGSEQEIKFSSKPSGAMVEVDKKMGKTPCTISLYRKKSYDARLTYKGQVHTVRIQSMWDLPWYAGIYDLFTASVYSLFPGEVHVEFD